MAKKADTTRWRVLRGVRNDKTGKQFYPGDVVKKGDFTLATMRAWAERNPPVLAVIEDKDGSNTDSR